MSPALEQETLDDHYSLTFCYKLEYTWEYRQMGLAEILG